MRYFLPIVPVILTITVGCQGSDPAAESPPLSDTLVTVYEAIVAAATTDRSEDFKAFLAPSELERLDRVRNSYGSVSLGWCLERQLGSWPDPDTLKFEDLVYQPPYARISFTGPGALAAYRDRVCYTFLLFQYLDTTWRLAGLSKLEKDRFDPYGSELTYLETELPSRLRFPRLF